MKGIILFLSFVLLATAHSFSQTVLPATSSFNELFIPLESALHLTSSFHMGKGIFSMNNQEGTRSDIERSYSERTIEIRSNKNEEEELVYPNPNRGKFSLRLNPNYQINYLAVINILGQTVYEKDFYGDKSEYSIDLSSQSPGIYFVELLSENDSTIKKIVIY